MQVLSAERGTTCPTVAILSAIGKSFPKFIIFPRANFKLIMLKGASAGSVGYAN